MKSAFETLEQEFERGKNTINSAIDYSERITRKINVMIQYYNKILKQIAKITTNQSEFQAIMNVIDSNEKSSVAPGFPGTQSDFFNNYFEILRQILLKLNDFGGCVKKSVIDQLLAVNESVAANTKSILAEHQLSISYRANCMILLRDCYTYLMQQQDKLEKQYKHFEANQTPKNEAELREACEQFRKQSLLLNQTYQQMYKAHQQYLKSVFNTLGRLKIAETRRGVQIKKILCNFTPANIATSKEELTTTNTNFEQKWSTDFVKFLVKNGIVRTTYAPIHFTPHKFSFSDPRVDFPPMLRPEYGKTVPISFGLVKKDFAAAPGTMEISVAKDEKIYLFDNIQSEWAYVRTKNGEGFIPTSIIENTIAKYAIATVPNLGIDNTLKASAGELFICHKRKGKYSYENINGEKGTIPEENMLHFK